VPHGVVTPTAPNELLLGPKTTEIKMINNVYESFMEEFSSKVEAPM